MTLDAHLWDALQDHGVTTAHMEMLLRLLQVQRNGSWWWQYVNGHLTHCEARLVFPSRGPEVSRVCETLLGGESSLR